MNKGGRNQEWDKKNEKIKKSKKKEEKKWKKGERTLGWGKKKKGKIDDK